MGGNLFLFSQGCSEKDILYKTKEEETDTEDVIIAILVILVLIVLGIGGYCWYKNRKGRQETDGKGGFIRTNPSKMGSISGSIELGDDVDQMHLVRAQGTSTKKGGMDMSPLNVEGDDDEEIVDDDDEEQLIGDTNNGDDDDEDDVELGS